VEKVPPMSYSPAPSSGRQDSARGIGWRSAAERADFLMQDAPDDLYEAARAKLLDPRTYPPEEIARRERLLERTIADLNAPLHPNCYLSPTQFAEKFR
jgi:hypothetical protein